VVCTCMYVCYVWEVKLSGSAGYEKGRRGRAPVGFRDVVEDESADLLFDITRLIADWDL
jgi:hypothetical protein